MVDDIEQDDGQYEQVLTRLDALMQRGHASTPPPEEPAAIVTEAEAAVDVPVLTEVFHGVESSPVAILEQEALPTSPAPAQPSREREVDFVVAELMPGLREMVAQVVQQELSGAQQALSSRISQEAEQVLRLRLLQETKPK